MFEKKRYRCNVVVIVSCCFSLGGSSHVANLGVCLDWHHVNHVALCLSKTYEKQKQSSSSLHSIASSRPFGFHAVKKLLPNYLRFVAQCIATLHSSHMHCTWPRHMHTWMVSACETKGHIEALLFCMKAMIKFARVSPPRALKNLQI